MISERPRLHMEQHRASVRSSTIETCVSVIPISNHMLPVEIADCMGRSEVSDDTLIVVTADGPLFAHAE